MVVDRLGRREPMVAADTYARISSEQAEAVSTRFENVAVGAI